jgi:hypothetical protein
MIFTPITSAAWKRGDFRMAASLIRGSHTIGELAARVGASLESFVEDGLGPAKVFSAVSESRRQVAFDFYELGPEGPNLLVLFEDGRCSGREVRETLAAFGVKLKDVYWFAPEMVDV